MFCSTIIPTVGRPTLARTVESVISQSVPGESCEVIVVNDSGLPLQQAEWQGARSVQIVTTQRRERSVARNTGAAVARGRYLHFLDDDDWLAPDALQHLWSAARAGTAGWIYGHSQLVDRRGEPLLQLRHALRGNCFVQAMAGEWIPLQASLLSADLFFAIGGFDPTISGPEDIDLLRRFCLRSELAVVPRVVAFIGLGTETSTTDYARHPEQSRRARERILDQPGVLRRMWGSASTGYWRGRMVRAYATSVVWNVGQRRFSTAASRGAFAAASLILAAPDVLSAGFWRAVRRPHASDAFNEGSRDGAAPEPRARTGW